MSLINKMLQDLDARGGAAPGMGAPVEVRPVSQGRRGPGAGLAAGAVALAVVLTGGAYVAWRYLQPPAAKLAAAQPAAALAAAAPSIPAHSAPTPSVNNGGMDDDSALRSLAQARQLAADKAARDVKAAGEAAAVPPPAGARREMPVAGDKRKAQNKDRETRQVARDASRRTTASPSARAPAAPVDDGTGSQQRSESEYRRALATLRDGRTSQAMAELEQALYLYPRHEAARQTLVGLLVEGKQYPEAMRHLQFAVGLDPQQSGMTMLLARLQNDFGGPAIDTLQRGLPYAQNNANYRALLAGMLQRAQRHHEAAEQYQSALRMQAGNGVWWMGLGISLQADKRNAEAREAFLRARDSGRLSAELQAFVERKLQQLAN